jgi:2-methylcitrate dehydratase PrpD
MTVTEAAGPTRHLGEFIASAPQASPGDLALARLSLIDTAFAFASSAGSAVAGAFLRPEWTGGDPDIELGGIGLPDATVTAALGFGSIAHSLDLDDWTTYGAAGASLWGTLLCLADAGPITDESRLLDAWCIGLRTGTALWATGRYRQADRGLDGTDVFGSIASAAAGARLLGLSPEQSAAAVAIAGSEMGGVVGNLGTDVEALHAGFAARNGFQAALLAQAGIYGSDNVLEARQGFGEAVFGPADGPLPGLRDALHDGPPLESLLRLRRYPCAIDHQRVITAVESLAAGRSVAVTELGQVRVEGVPPTSEGTRYAVPHSGVEARRSLRYALACLLADGSVTPAHFTDEAVASGRLTALLERVEVDILPRWDARLLSSPAEAVAVAVTLPSGELLTADPSAAPLTLDADGLLAKWEALADGAGSWTRSTLDAWRTAEQAETTFRVLEAIRTS